MRQLSLIKKIFIFLFSGIIVGLVCRTFGWLFPITILVTIREIFSEFLTFLIPLIILGLIVPGIAHLGNKSGKSLFVTTVITYVSTLSAGLVAFMLGRLILPLLIPTQLAILSDSVTIDPLFFIEIPPLMSVMSALVFAFIFGIGLSAIKKGVLYHICDEFNEIVMKLIMKVIMPMVPIYVGAIFATISYSGDIFVTLQSFALVFAVLFILQFLYLAVLYLLSSLVKMRSPIELINNMWPAFMTAAGTQSSVATIPVTLQCMKKNGVKDEVSEFVIPLTATIHLAGDTIALVITSMALMYMNGAEPSFSMYIPFIVMLGITMIAAPGVPGGGVMAALGLLETMLGFGSLEKPLMIALHAAQDSIGTATNVMGDGALTMIVEKVVSRFQRENVQKK